MTLTQMFRFKPEAKAVALVASLQFVCALDFIMVLPMGPDLARGLQIPAAHVGYIASSYGLAAFIFGLGCAGILDRFDRRKALGFCVLGLVLATAMCGLATGMVTLLAARFAAGAFAGPVIAIGLAVVSDATPPERRGRAVTAVVTAGSIASVFGVPAGIVLAQVGGWRAPFLTIAGLGLVIASVALWILPPMVEHLRGSARETLGTKLRMMASPVGAAAMVCALLSAASGFVIVSSIASHLQINLHFPRSAFGGLYMAGGAAAFLLSRVSGRVIDRVGSWPVMLTSNLLFGFVAWELFVRNAASVPVVALFIGSMTANSLRNGALQTILTRIPPAGRRAAFLSVTGAMQQLGSAAGAAGAGLLLHEAAGPVLQGMDKVGWVAIGLTATLTPLILLVDFLRRRSPQAAQPASEAAEAPGETAREQVLDGV